MKIGPHKFGLVLGITFVIYHLSWLVSLLLGFGDLWLKWTGSLHSVKFEYQILEFDLITAIVGLVGAFIVGYLMGWVFRYVWKFLDKK